MQLFSKKQASHQNSDLIFLTNVLNFYIEMRCIYQWMLKILITWKQFIFLILWFFFKYMKNIANTLSNIISQNKCDRMQIHVCYNSLEWIINMALRWGKILNYPPGQWEIRCFYGICVHLHYTLHYSLLLKIATENLSI